MAIVVLVILVAAGVTAGLVVALSGGGGTPATRAATLGGARPRTTHAQAVTVPGATMSHARYLRLWNTTDVGASMRAVLTRWPQPYQVYLDSSGNRCYEWLDQPSPDLHPYLYNLCFKHGVVLTKDEA